MRLMPRGTSPSVSSGPARLRRYALMSTRARFVGGRYGSVAGIGEIIVHVSETMSTRRADGSFSVKPDAVGVPAGARVVSGVVT